MENSGNTARVILIAGPTGSGKSALAMALASRLGGVVINADSMQVYRDLRVITARPTREDEARVPHDLYGFVDGAEAYSAARYGADASAAIARARDAGRVPIMVGGTGLYFASLLDGLAPIPPIPEAVRTRWREAAERDGAAALYRELMARDPVSAARIGSTDPQRLVRALEVLEATGRSLSDWQREAGQPVIEREHAVRLLVDPDRADVHRRCDSRFDRMLADGALDEVAALVARGLDARLPVMRALGVRPLAAHLAGALSLTDARDRAKAETRQYVKRQATWFRGRMGDWMRVADREAALATVVAQLDGH